MKASIWAQTEAGIIGKGGRIPWNYPGDLKRFKRVTSGGAIVMGRNTWESIGRPLPRRRNIVVSWTMQDAPIGVTVVRSLDDAVRVFDGDSDFRDLWFIGGCRVYEAAMLYVDLIDVTYVPDRVETSPSAVSAPTIDESVFRPMFETRLQHEDEPTLTRQFFVRRSLVEPPYDDANNRWLQELGYMSRRP